MPGSISRVGTCTVGAASIQVGVFNSLLASCKNCQTYVLTLVIFDASNVHMLRPGINTHALQTASLAQAYPSIRCELTDLQQLDFGCERRSIVKAHLNDIGQHDFQVLDASLELVVVIVPLVGVHIQDTVVQCLQALDELLKRALQAITLSKMVCHVAVVVMPCDNITLEADCSDGFAGKHLAVPDTLALCSVCDEKVWKHGVGEFIINAGNA